MRLFDQDLRIDLEIPGTRKETTPYVVRFTRLGGGMNFIEYAWWKGADIDRVICDQVNHFLPLGQPFEWNLYGHDAPAEIPYWLQQHGFSLHDEPGSMMVLDLARVPDAMQNPHPAEVRKLASRAELVDVAGVLEEVWGGSYEWIHKRLGDHMEIPGYLSVYAAVVDGIPASVGWTYFHNNSVFANLYGGSTRSKFRGRGLYKAILAARVQEAIQRGRRYLIVDTNANSRPIVECHGFCFLTTSYSYQYDRSS